MPASSSRLILPRRAAACGAGTHTSGSKSPRTIASSGASSASGLVVSQPRPASARRCAIIENSASRGASIQATSTSASAAADRSAEAVCTARASGRRGGTTTRSRGRPRPAACRVRLTSWSTRDSTFREASSSTVPAAVSRRPSRRRCSSGAPTISSSRRICWLSVGWVMNIRSAAWVKLPSSASATKYRRCRSSIAAGAACTGSAAGSVCAWFMSSPAHGRLIFHGHRAWCGAAVESRDRLVLCGARAHRRPPGS
jgi:hypothetical protein